MPGFPFELHLGHKVAFHSAPAEGLTYNGQPVTLHGIAVGLAQERRAKEKGGSRTLTIESPHAGEFYRCQLKDEAFEAGLIFSGVHIPFAFAATVSIVTAKHGIIVLRPIPSRSIHVLPDNLPTKPSAAAEATCDSLWRRCGCPHNQMVEQLRLSVKELSGAPIVLARDIQEIHVNYNARDGVNASLECTQMAIVSTAVHFFTADGKLESAALLPGPASFAVAPPCSVPCPAPSSAAAARQADRSEKCDQPANPKKVAEAAFGPASAAHTLRICGRTVLRPLRAHSERMAELRQKGMIVGRPEVAEAAEAAEAAEGGVTRSVGEAAAQGVEGEGQGEGVGVRGGGSGEATAAAERSAAAASSPAEYIRRLSTEQRLGFSRAMVTRTDVPPKPAAMALPAVTASMVTEMVVGARGDDYGLIPPHSLGTEADTKRVPDRPPSPKPLPEPKVWMHPLPYRLTDGSERLRLLERAREPETTVLLTRSSVVVVEASSRRVAVIKLKGSFQGSSADQDDAITRYFSLGQLEEGAAAVPIFDPDSPTDFPQFATVCKKPDPRDPGAEGASHVPSGSHRYYVYYVVLINANGDVRPVHSASSRMEISCDVPHKLVVRKGSVVEVRDLGASGFDRSWTLEARIQGDDGSTALDACQPSASRLLVMWSGAWGKNRIIEYTIADGSATPTGRSWTSYLHFLGDARLAEEGGQHRRRLITLMTQPRSSWHFVEEEDAPLLRFLDAETMEDVNAPVVAGTLEQKQGAKGRGKIWTEEVDTGVAGAFLLFEDDGSEQGTKLPRLAL